MTGEGWTQRFWAWLRRTEIEKRLAAIGKKVQMVVNYDNVYLAPDLADAYVTLVRRLAEHYYAAAK